jgi:hypothetical protein
MILGFADGDRVAFLEHFVDCDEGFESLHFVCEDGLPVNKKLVRFCSQSGKRKKGCIYIVHFHARPKRSRGLVVPSVHNATAHMFSWCSRQRLRNREIGSVRPGRTLRRSFLCIT